METIPILSNNITNMYNENSRGPRTDPCGTPYFTGLRHYVGRFAKHHPNVYAIKEGVAIILAVVLLLPPVQQPVVCRCESKTTVFGIQKRTQLEISGSDLQHCSRTVQPKYWSVFSTINAGLLCSKTVSIKWSSSLQGPSGASDSQSVSMF